MKIRLFNVLAVLMVLSLALSACGGAQQSSSGTTTQAQPEATAAGADTQASPEASEAATPEAATGSGAASGGDVSGSITVLTNRTDLVNTTFVTYTQQFNQIYPNVKVEFEALTDYAGESKIRMNTKDYGDVLLIPDDVPVTQLPDFFEPLGTVEELGQKYMFVTEKAYNGQVYGLPVTGNTQGIVYNKDVFKQAGIENLPTTPEEFIADLKLIKEKTDAIPLYTNYAAGWPLTQWMGHLQSVTCDPDAMPKLARTDTPFGEGGGLYTIYKLMHDVVKEGLTEDDPTTTDWESSKPMIGEGKIGTMVLGSWAIVQMQQAAKDPNSIGYMPFPSNQDGKQCAGAGGDYKIAINKNSENKAAARAWIDWFLNESNFAYDQGGIPPVKGADLPPQLQDFQKMNVEFVPANPAPAGEEGWVDKIGSESEIGLWNENFPRRIVDAARGSTNETFEQIVEDLNTRWAEARAEVTGGN